MTNGTKKTTAVLAGAVALASAGYALGSQSDDGTAGAASGSKSTSAGGVPAVYGYAGGGPRKARGGGPGFGDLAERLGVSQDKLRTALEAVRDDQQGDRRDDHTAALAKALGKSTAEVEAAFEKLRTAKEDEFAAAIGKALGVEASRVKAAFEKFRPDRDEPRERGDRRELLADVAKELGVTQAKLRSALRSAFPGRRDRGDHQAELAKALGVTEQQLEDAREQLHDEMESQREERRKAFAAALAKELGISAAKVEEELGDGPFGGRGFGGPGGPGGPGGHRGFGPR